MANANITEAELEELRRKFKLLEGDRKAYYEISIHQMKENKQIMAQLRSENKDLRKALATAQREAVRASKTGGALANEDISDLERHVALLRKNYDTMRCTVEVKRGQLQKLKDKASELELEAQRPNADGSPLTRKIRMLENRLDKAMIKYNEAQSIRKTYEQIVKRLKEERVGFDNQLGAIERTLHAKQHDYEELLLLSGDANHAREVSVQELERCKNGLDEKRKCRQRELEERKELADLKTTMADRTEKRENMRRDMIAKAQGDLSQEEEDKLKKTMVANAINSDLIKAENKQQRAKIDVYEDAFRKIKEATGVADVNEVIQKIVSQEDTQANLLEMTRTNSDRCDALLEEKTNLKNRVEEIKYSGTGGGHRRKMVDDHEEGYSLAATKLERARFKYERTAKILINVKAGVDHLADKLEHVRDDGKQIVMNNDTIADVLYMCEQALVNTTAKMKDAEGDEADDFGTGTSATSLNDMGSSVLANRPYNQRVALPSGEDVADFDMPELGDGGDDDGDQELSRASIKKAAKGLVASQERKAKKKRKGGAKGHATKGRKARPV